MAQRLTTEGLSYPYVNAREARMMYQACTRAKRCEKTCPAAAETQCRKEYRQRLFDIAKDFADSPAKRRALGKKIGKIADEVEASIDSGRIKPYPKIARFDGAASGFFRWALAMGAFGEAIACANGKMLPAIASALVAGASAIGDQLVSSGKRAREIEQIIRNRLGAA